MPKVIGLGLVVLAAFWFAAENAGEMVLVDLVLFRLRVSLPLLVFGSVLGGMGLSLFVGWRADRATRRRPGRTDPTLLQDRHDLFDPAVHEYDAPERERSRWS